MLSKSFSLLFYLKKPKNYVQGNQPVYLRITVDAARMELSMQRECEPTRWNAHAGRANGTKEDIKSLNVYLDSVQAKVYEAHRSLLDKKEPITVENMKRKLGGVTERPRMLLEIFRYHNDQMQQLIQNDEFAKGTWVHFTTTCKHLANFIQQKFHQKDRSITEIDYSFIADFELYLKTGICAHNTAMKYLGDFRKIVLLCLKKGWLQKDPFFGYKLSRREVNREVLTANELQAMADKQFASERVTLVRDIFLFSCFTGLAYADVAKLKRTEITIGIDGEKWVFTKRTKTDSPSRIPLLPMSLAILAKYEDHPRCCNSGLLLPVISNQKMNAYLKEIADLCGIHKPLTFHIARHTFATTVTLSNGVPMETVSKMLGHKNLRTTQHYAKILDKKISEDMQALRCKLSLKNKVS
jgi:site-specific recombinase XerD